MLTLTQQQGGKTILPNIKDLTAFELNIQPILIKITANTTMLIIDSINSLLS